MRYSNFDYDEDMLAKLEETKGADYDLVIADDYIIELAVSRQAFPVSGPRPVSPPDASIFL